MGFSIILAWTEQFLAMVWDLPLSTESLNEATWFHGVR